MSFECKHKENNHCALRHAPCKPGAEGCVLNKKVEFVDLRGDGGNDTRSTEAAEKGDGG